MDLYFERHDGQAATVEDFVTCFEDANGADLKQFSLWYQQAGTPLVTVSEAWDAKAASFTLTLEQAVAPTPGQTDKQPMHIPVRIGLLSRGGAELQPGSVSGAEMTGDVLHLREAKQTVTFSGLSERPVVSLNRSFSAPVNLRFEQPEADVALIARHESDLYSRWQAMNSLALKDLRKAVLDLREGRDVTASPALVEAVISTARDGGLEPAFRAQALNLPSEADLSRELKTDNDPDANHRARRAVLACLAQAGHAEFEAIHTAMSASGPYTPDAQGAGKRALANAALGYLALHEKDPARAATVYASADNMTVLSHALSVLAHHFPDAPETLAALAAFEERFRDNALVIDKWFAVQASIPGGETLQRVKALLESPLFNKRNPNRVRSLVGTFCFANPTGFNRADGEGYRFLANQILEHDGANPQLAARLLTSLRSWQSLEAGRAAHAKSALETIQGANALSVDVRDIVDRMLG